MLRGLFETIVRCLRVRGLALPFLALAVVAVGAHPAGDPGGPFPTAAKTSPEYQVKAAFLFNFTKYVKWPEKAFEGEDSPLVVAVVGKDPFGSVLDETLKSKSIGKHPLVIRRFSSVDRLDACHLLFVPASEADRVKKIVQHYEGSSTLLVGEPDGFSTNGGVIRFVLADKKVRFEVNTDAAKRARVEISSQLLKLARIVTDKERKK
jgi:hypothetical protein